MIPAAPGTYLLRLHLDQEEIIQVGQLGRFIYPRGDYLYAGSAMGPGGLKSRLRRHLNPEKKIHWHIDYLRARSQPTGVIFTSSIDSLECAWSQTCAGLPGAEILAPGFGARDCRSGCRSHLVFFREDLGLETLLKVLKMVTSERVISLEWGAEDQKPLNRSILG